MTLRLSTIERMPDRALPAVRWLHERIAERRMPKTEMRKLFNEQLDLVSVGPVSSSSFDRYVSAVRVGSVAKPSMTRSAQPDIVAAFERVEAAVYDMRRALNS